MKMNMSNEYKEQLQRQYNSFVNLDERNFFLGLADYVKFIIETPDLASMVNNILGEKKKDTEEFENLKEKAKQELKKSGERFVKEIIKTILPTIKEVAKESQKDQIEQLKSPLEVIHDPTLVEDIFRFQDNLYKNITPRRAAKLISLMKSLKRKYLSSQICLKYSREKTYQEYLPETTVWGSWYELKLVYDLIHQRKEIAQEIEEGEDLSSRVAIMFLSGEIDTVLKKRPLLPIFRKFDILWRNFTKNNYIIHLNRVHNYFMGQIESEALEIDKTRKHQEENIPQKPKNNALIPLKLPLNVSWEKITIEFKNEYDVEIKVDQKPPYQYNYETMGFADERIKKKEEKTKTNDSWELLTLLSIGNGIFPLGKLTGREKKKRIKQKQSLSETLKKLFPTVTTIDDDPFYKYNDIKKIYKIKIKLIPIKTFREDFRDRNIREEKDKLTDLHDFMADETSYDRIPKKPKGQTSDGWKQI